MVYEKGWKNRSLVNAMILYLNYFYYLHFVYLFCLSYSASHCGKSLSAVHFIYTGLQF